MAPKGASNQKTISICELLQHPEQQQQQLQPPVPQRAMPAPASPEPHQQLRLHERGHERSLECGHGGGRSPEGPLLRGRGMRVQPLVLDSPPLAHAAPASDLDPDAAPLAALRAAAAFGPTAGRGGGLLAVPRPSAAGAAPATPLPETPRPALLVPPTPSPWSPCVATSAVGGASGTRLPVLLGSARGREPMWFRGLEKETLQWVDDATDDNAADDRAADDEAAEADEAEEDADEMPCMRAVKSESLVALGQQQDRGITVQNTFISVVEPPPSPAGQWASRTLPTLPSL